MRERAWKDYERDREFFPALEAALPKGAMVFEFPIKDYPEMGPIREMGDYEHFRPILHSTDLRVSYGTIKGRGDTVWQKALASISPEEIRATLERYGFAAILINRKAYEDSGTGLLTGLETAGAKPLMENQDFFVLGLQPNPNPMLPEIVKPVRKKHKNHRESEIK